MSEIAKAIDDCIGLKFVPLLKQEGFRKRGRTFHRKIAHVSQIVNVQASRNNIGADGSFTLNLGVYFPAVDLSVRGAAVPDVPKEYDCTLRERIGSLLPDRTDKWWKLAPGTDYRAISDEICAAWTQAGKPWFERRATLPEAYEACDGQFATVQVEIPMAMALLLGRQDEAQRRLEEFLSQPNAYPAYRKGVIAWARGKGLAIDA
jgi:uncharacterized protein DUF4304